MKRGILADASLILAAIIWGSGFIATQMALDAGYHPFTTLFLRFLVATVIMGVFFYKKMSKDDWRHIGPGLIVGAFLFLGFAAQTTGLLTTTPSNNAFLTAVNVVLVPFIGFVVFKDRPKRKSVIGALVCFLGIALLTYKPGGGESLSVGDLLSLLCAVFFAFHIVAVGYYAKKVNTYFLVFIQMLVATVSSFICMLVVGESVTSLYRGVEGFSAVMYLGVFSTCVCFFIQNMAQRHTSSTKAAIFLSLESLFGTAFSVMLGYEPITVSLFIGGLLIFSAIIITEVNFKGLNIGKSKADSLNILVSDDTITYNVQGTTGLKEGEEDENK